MTTIVLTMATEGFGTEERQKRSTWKKTQQESKRDHAIEEGNQDTHPAVQTS